jgi:hypothetical protein
MSREKACSLPMAPGSAEATLMVRRTADLNDGRASRANSTSRGLDSRVAAGSWDTVKLSFTYLVLRGKERAPNEVLHSLGSTGPRSPFHSDRLGRFAWRTSIGGSRRGFFRRHWVDEMDLKIRSQLRDSVTLAIELKGLYGLAVTVPEAG